MSSVSSTVAANTAATRGRVQELISYVERGKILEAIEEFYDEDVVMQENANPPTVGKAANREREAAFGQSIAQVHENRAASVLVDGDRAAIHWIFDYTDKDGKRTRLDEIAHQSWRADKIVQERFYYDPAATTTAPAAGDVAIEAPARERREALVVPAGGGPLAELGDSRGHVKVSAQSSGGDFVLFEVQADPGANVPPHIHRREDETFYVLEGQFLIEVSGQATLAGPGDTVFGPRGLAHTWSSAGAEGGRLLILVSPGANFEAFALEMARRGFVPSAAMADPAQAAAFIALNERYGIEMLPTIK